MMIAANIGDVAVLDFETCFPDSIVGFVPQNGVAGKLDVREAAELPEEAVPGDAG